MLRRMMQALVYGRMMSVFGQIPASMLEDMGLSDLKAREARAYEVAYGVPRAEYDGL